MVVRGANSHSPVYFNIWKLFGHYLGTLGSCGLGGRSVSLKIAFGAQRLTPFPVYFLFPVCSSRCEISSVPAVVSAACIHITLIL